jgi:hypothetical protein
MLRQSEQPVGGEFQVAPDSVGFSVESDLPYKNVNGVRDASAVTIP